jgi:hypothetical protein
MVITSGKAYSEGGEIVNLTAWREQRPSHDAAAPGLKPAAARRSHSGENAKADFPPGRFAWFAMPHPASQSGAAV